MEHTRELEIFDDVISSMPWKIIDAKQGFGSFLNFDCLDRSLNRKFLLWIYMCDWEILVNDLKLLDSSMEDKNQEDMKIFSEKAIKKIEFNIENGIFKFIISDNIALNVHQNLQEYEISDDLFKIFANDGNVICFNPKDKICIRE